MRRLLALLGVAALGSIAGVDAAKAQFASTTYPSTALPALPTVTTVTQVLAPAAALSFSPAQSTFLRPSAASIMVFVDQLAQQQDDFSYGQSFRAPF